MDIVKKGKIDLFKDGLQAQSHGLSWVGNDPDDLKNSAALQSRH